MKQVLILGVVGLRWFLRGAAVWLSLTAGVLISPMTQAANSGVALQYHRISDSGPDITRLGPEQFNAHLELIERLGFSVVPLDSLLAGLCDSSAESTSAIAITFDDAHRTVYEQAWPLLRARSWPFVVFVNTAAVDQRHGGAMSWDQLRELAQGGAIIGNHGVDHEHLIRQPAQWNLEQWSQWRRQQIIDAQRRIDDEIGPQPKIFAYPFGEYDLATVKILDELGYSAFGQQSGAFGCASHRQALPRFPVSGTYADIESVELKLASLPFPTIGSIHNPVQQPGHRQPLLMLTLGDELGNGFEPSLVRCYASGQGAIDVFWDAPQHSLIAQAPAPLPIGRSRYNCTLRNAVQQRYHWFSQAWFIPGAQGDWPPE